MREAEIFTLLSISCCVQALCAHSAEYANGQMKLNKFAYIFQTKLLDLLKNFEFDVVHRQKPLVLFFHFL